MKKKQQTDPSLKDHLAEKIAGRIVRMQVYLATWLSRQERKLKLAHRKLLFFLFVALCSVYCLVLLVKGFSLKEPQSPSLSPADSIRLAPLQLPPPLQEFEKDGE